MEAFATKVVVLHEPTAVLGVKETGRVLNLIRTIQAKGLPVILISHNMPNVFEVVDRVHIARLGGRAGIITPQSHPHRSCRNHDRRHDPAERLNPRQSAGLRRPRAGHARDERLGDAARRGPHSEGGRAR